jgi:hypothetical protein
MPNDYFSLQIAEVLLRTGEKEEGEKLLNEIIEYSKGYLDFIINLEANERYGLDYTTAINMQSFVDVYNLAQQYKIDILLKTVESDLNRYYSTLYSGK